MSLRSEASINVDLYQIRRKEPSDGDGNMADTDWILDVNEHQDNFRDESYCINIIGEELEYENSLCYDPNEGYEQWCLA